MKNEPALNNIIFEKNYKKYVLIICIILNVLFFPLVLNYLFLIQSGEYLSPSKIYEQQNNSENKKVLYGSALFDNVAQLKLTTIEKKKPKVVVVGSSRVLQFREKFFSQSFYNMGFTIKSVQDAINIIDLATKNFTPEVIILGIDTWWFNENFIKPTYNRKYITETNIFDPVHTLMVASWLYHKKVTISNFLKILAGDSGGNIGVRGKLLNSGYGPDGSSYYTDIVTGKSDEYNHNEIKFNENYKKIHAGEKRYMYGSQASIIHYKKFLELIKKLQDRKIKVILFYPPIAQELVQEMKKFNYGYEGDLKNKFINDGIKVYDFSNPHNTISLNNCELIDGFHGGDILYARIIYFLSQINNDLRKYVAVDYIKDVITRYAGLTMIPDPKITTDPEIDFSHMGCRKSFNKF